MDVPSRGQPTFRGNEELALRGGSGRASATEEHFWIGAAKDGYPNTEE